MTQLFQEKYNYPIIIQEPQQIITIMNSRSNILEKVLVKRKKLMTTLHQIFINFIPFEVIYHSFD